MTATAENGELEAARERLMQEIARDARETAMLTGRETIAPGVMAAMRAVPRHEFAAFPSLRDAWANAPWPIGQGQTISQPFIVALMTDLLDPAPDHEVLEIGTGCGYQAAVLSRVVRRVRSIEVVPELAREAAARLARLGYDNVEVRAGDGASGWPEAAPHDGIIVTAAAREVPQALVGQLKPGGRLVIPVGRPWSGQDLVVVSRADDGEIRRQRVLPVAFVPMT